MPSAPPANRAEAGGARGVVALAPAGGGAGRIWLFGPRAARRCRDARGDGAAGALIAARERARAPLALWRARAPLS